jgi:hypothetical protein
MIKVCLMKFFYFECTIENKLVRPLFHTGFINFDGLNCTLGHIASTGRLQPYLKTLG